MTATRYLGAGTRVGVDIGGMELTAFAPAGQPVPAPGARVGLAWEPGTLHRMEPDGWGNAESRARAHSRAWSRRVKYTSKYISQVR